MTPRTRRARRRRKRARRDRIRANELERVAAECLANEMRILNEALERCVESAHELEAVLVGRPA